MIFYLCDIVIGRGQTRTITKTVPNESFFNFFDPPAGKNIHMFNIDVLTSFVAPKDDDDDDDDDEDYVSIQTYTCLCRE